MEVMMAGLTKKTTILLPPELHARLARLAVQRGMSMGELIRSACEHQYGLAGTESRRRAVDSLASLGLPVGSPEDMKRESVPASAELLP